MAGRGQVHFGKEEEETGNYGKLVGPATSLSPQPPPRPSGWDWCDRVVLPSAAERHVGLPSLGIPRAPLSRLMGQSHPTRPGVHLDSREQLVCRETPACLVGVWGDGFPLSLASKLWETLGRESHLGASSSAMVGSSMLAHSPNTNLASTQGCWEPGTGRPRASGALNSIQI